VDETQVKDLPREVLSSPVHSSTTPSADPEPRSNASSVPASPLQLNSKAFPLPTGEDYSSPPAQASPSPSVAAVAPSVQDYESILGSPTDTAVPEDTSTSTAAVTSSPVASVAPESFPQLQHSLSPEGTKVNGTKSRKRWGSSTKSDAKRSSKDGPKGFKRLLHFGRRSKNSTTSSTTEWVSASTEEDDGAEETKVAGIHSGEARSKKEDPNLNISRPTAVNGKSTNLRYMSDSPHTSSKADEDASDRGSGEIVKFIPSLSSNCLYAFCLPVMYIDLDEELLVG
jgi:hypothetical protein